MKTCSCCAVAKPPDDFLLDGNGVDGRNACCRLCHNAATRARWRANRAGGDGVAAYQERKRRIKAAAAAGEPIPNLPFRRRTAGAEWRGKQGWCVHCFACKPAAAFSTDVRKRNGLASRCQACDKIYRMELKLGEIA